MTKKIELGDRVKDQISGMTGIAYQIAECLHGCRRIHVEPDRLSKDGGICDGYWFDEMRLSIVKKAVVPRPKKEVFELTGGPNTKIMRERA